MQDSKWTPVIMTAWANRAGGWLTATVVAAIAFCGIGLTGCYGNPPTHEQVQQQAANATVAVKQDAKDAVAASRKAAAVAESDLNDVAIGVKAGMHKDGTPTASSRVSINTATRVRLALLPGITFGKAGEIVDKRPYASSRQLVSRGVLTPAEFAKIAPEITVH